MGAAAVAREPFSLIAYLLMVAVTTPHPIDWVSARVLSITPRNGPRFYRIVLAAIELTGLRSWIYRPRLDIQARAARRTLCV
jgi:hypothetical protein